jgi:hypothetical protein
MPKLDEIDAELYEIDAQVHSLLARRDELQAQRAAALVETDETEVRGNCTKSSASVDWRADFEWSSRMDDLKRMFNVSEWRFEQARSSVVALRLVLWPTAVLLQRAIINCTLSKIDAFVIMPTGGGKRFGGNGRDAPSGRRRAGLFCSLCYQLPAVLSGGVNRFQSPPFRARQPPGGRVLEAGYDRYLATSFAYE